MRLAFAFALLLALLAACAPRDPAAAADAQGQACDTEPNWSLRVTACTALIRTEGTSAERRASAYLNRGAARAQLLQQSRAVADFGRALRLDPNLAGAYFERGLVHHDRGAFDQAVADYDRALRLDPNMQAAIERRAIAQSGQVEDFATRLNRADMLVSAAPNDPVNYNNRCWVRAVEGVDLDSALADCNASLRLAPNNAQTLDSRGLVYLKRGDYFAALADYEAANTLQPEQAHFIYGRGLARLHLGQAGEGAADLRSALALDPDIGETYQGYGASPPAAAADDKTDKP